MKKLTEEEFNRNWMEFLQYFERAGLTKYLDPNTLMDAMKVSAAAITDESGAAYPGGLLKHINLVCALSERLAKTIGNTFPIDGESLFKVCILHQIAKAEMYTINTNQWEIDKRGMNYTFVNAEGCLRVGERSLLNAYSMGIPFTAQEFEAMRILDRTPEEMTNLRGHLGILSIIIKCSNDIAYALEREQWRKEKINK